MCKIDSINIRNIFDSSFQNKLLLQTLLKSFTNMKFKSYADNSSDEFWHLLYLGLLLTQYLHDSKCGTYSICQFSGTQMFNYKQKENLYTKAKCNVLKKISSDPIHDLTQMCSLSCRCAFVFTLCKS